MSQAAIIRGVFMLGKSDHVLHKNIFLPAAVGPQVY